jgi:hypothetical protein
MTSNTYLPTLDQGLMQNFRSSFFELAQQKTSQLESSGAVIYLPSAGKTNNMARIGRLELSEVAQRNPDKQYGDYSIDNRLLTKRRFTRTITVDALYDINELIADPSSSILQQLVNAKSRTIDRVIAAAAVGTVNVGAPNGSPTAISAATDGVLTVDASAGLTYDKIQEITQNFINNELEYSMFKGSILCLTGTENTDLMGEVEFISSDYITGRPVETGKMQSAGTYQIAMFAGSVNGGATVTNPVLAEGTTTRSCICLAPESIAISMELADLGITRSATKVNSNDITIDLWINAMRTEGCRVQIVTTTI